MAKFSDLDKRDEPARQSEALARRSLNALAVTSSIVNALVQYPGPGSEHESMVKAAKTMLAQADEMATRLNSRLDLESVPWARYRLMRMTTEAVSSRWIASARQSDEPNADISDFLPIWREMAKYDLPTFHFDEPSQDERVMMQISVLDAMQPVLQEIALFDLFHDPIAAAMHAREQIVSAANEAVADLLPPDASRRAQAQLLQALLRNAGAVYASNWRRLCEEVIEKLEPLTIEQQEKEVTARPGGWSLSQVDDGFRNTFDKLADMVAFLANPATPVANYESRAEVQSESFDVRSQSNQAISGAANTSGVVMGKSRMGLFDSIDGTEDMDEAPHWSEEDTIDLSNDPGFASTASMVEPGSMRRAD